MNWRSTTYTYTKQRRFFGRQPLFSDHYPEHIDIPPDHELLKDFVLDNPIDRSTQVSKQFALSIVNTDIVKLQNRGMCHNEGGWPKDVKFTDEEAVIRYRKKIEREESWQKNVCDMEEPMMKVILQNNAINIYENYFEGMEILELGGNYTACVLNEFRDLATPKRPISSISWKPNDSEKFVASYGFTNLYNPPGYSYDNYIWDINDPMKPINYLKSSSFATCINWNPKDIHILAGALYDGSVCYWDARMKEDPIAISPIETSHKDICSTLIWVQSKSNTEFYSGSMNGTIHFWDIRNLSKPFNIFKLNSIKTDEQNIHKAHGCTVLEFEYTIPVRFMAGTDKGYIFFGNRKATKPNEIIIGNFQAMSGPIKSLERNPFYVKYFLVVGDWCSKIWTEDCKDSPLTRCINYETQLNCGTWSQNRCSLYFTGCKDGRVDFWDLLLNQNEPIYTMNMFKSPITSLKGSPNGKYVAVGTENGSISLVELGDGLHSSRKNDKVLLSAFFDREVRRVKIIEGRLREILLKMHTNKKSPEKFKTDAITDVSKEMLEEQGEEEEGSVEEIENNIVTDLNTEELEIPEIPEDDEELEKYAIDPLLPEISRQYFKTINEEEKKRNNIEKTFVKTPFELEYNDSEQLEIPSIRKTKIYKDYGFEEEGEVEGEEEDRYEDDRISVMTKF